MKRAMSILLVVALLIFSGAALAAEKTITLNVDHMTCTSCPITVKASLTAVPGVNKVEVSLEKKTAVVTYDDAKASVADLINATTNAGYPSQLAAQ
jgi:mercuric ion binding protein